MSSEKLYLKNIEAGYFTSFSAQVTIAEEDKRARAIALAASFVSCVFIIFLFDG